MSPAPNPPDEEMRLKALRRWALLDTPREEVFDDLARIAASAFGVSTALVSLVDGERQWFKASVGTDLRETSRDHSVCAHAILDPASPFIVGDTRVDPRFRDNPVLAEAGYRFYAGVPLVDPAGMPLGTICVLGFDPQRSTEELESRLEVLVALSRVAMRLIEYRAAGRALAEGGEDGST